ncbi:tetratricopeptide (TPR) repeat protein [Brevibacillus aydinogluensis]|uniref:tetratricopeptide repeat protein n=1 Tax=Brevibacillus aydinogluensis TaxID=927786 RepID=UPI002892E9DE|nr:tetratricopeptide repeat protein [Brevibacillus aydinogluensis]MDT3415103.1 tetratricopeptide (TPR) repeat protein [Brevibacillus aydinogluensis]
MKVKSQTSRLKAQREMDAPTLWQTLKRRLQERGHDSMFWLLDVEHGIAAVRENLADMDVKIFVVDGTESDTLGFSSLMPLIREALGVLMDDKREEAWLKSVASEVLYLMPELRSDEKFRSAPALDAIAVAPSRRRLHKESEQMFRVTQMVVTLLVKYARRQERSILFHFEHLERMDEHTLTCIARLAQCLFSLPAAITATVHEEGVPDVLAASGAGTGHVAFFPVAKIRIDLLNRIAEKTGAILCSLKGKAYQAPARERQPAGEAAAAANAEREKTRAFREALRRGDVQAIETAVLELSEVSVFTKNHDHSLRAIAQVWPMLPRFSTKNRVEVIHLLGILYAYMGDFPTAIDVFTYGGQFVSDPVQAAENKFFLALLYTKRLNDSVTGRDYIAQALECLAGVQGELADIERTWLNNLCALTYVNEKNRSAAYECCLKALDYIKHGHRSSDAIHIKINLISNITVLHEYGKELDKAIAKWMFFEKFLKASGPVFAKHYYYRKGGLQYKNRQVAEAITSLTASYRLACDLHSLFYQDVIARGLAGVYFWEGQYEEAAHWYQLAIDAKKKLLQEDNLPKVALGRALSLRKQGRTLEAEQVLREALDLQPTGDAAEKAKKALSRWNDLSAEELEELISYAIDKPDTKLNRPFDLTNLY